jgi:hypothetical protein
MRAINRRLRRIEARLTPPNNPEDQRGESSLRDLIRRRCEKTGHPYVGPTPEFAGLSLTEIARARLRKMHEGQGNHRLEGPGGAEAVTMMSEVATPA